MKKLGILAIAGGLFGAGLALGGMTNPRRVTGFLDITGTWDPSLVFVMAGAVGTYALAMAVARARWSGRGWFGTRLPQRDTSPIDVRLVLGALVFGIGWGLGGFCPGPALANLSAARVDALVFVPAMIVGMLLARVGFGADQD